MLESIDINSDGYLLISGIQHFIFCRRQWALIHIEQQWEENFFTIDGKIKHNRVDNKDIFEQKKDIRIIRSMPVVSHKLKIQGVCDLVELIPDDQGYYFSKYQDRYKVYPVEYKRGKSKLNDSDRLQLLAQAVALEEMLGLEIKEGACFYFETRKREQVLFTNEMRDKLNAIVKEMDDYYSRRYTPKVKKAAKCNACSLKDICLPEMDKLLTVSEYIEKRLLD